MSWCAEVGLTGWLMVAAVVALVVLATWAITRVFPATAAPLDVLERRLASGDVDLDTYRQLRAELVARSPA